MSFNDMKVSELRKVAETFGIELAVKATKNDIISGLEEEGVTYDMYAKFTDSPKVELESNVKNEPLKLDKKNTILVRMDRANPTFSVGRHTFTREHPFVAMSEPDAQYIFDNIDGFRPATPRELQEFYG